MGEEGRPEKNEAGAAASGKSREAAPSSADAAGGGGARWPCPVPENELVHFIVNVRFWCNREMEPSRRLKMIKNLADRMFRSYIGYRLDGSRRLKARGERCFSDAVKRTGVNPLAGRARVNPRLAAAMGFEPGGAPAAVLGAATEVEAAVASPASSAFVGGDGQGREDAMKGSQGGWRVVEAGSHGVKVRWLGHACVLVERAGKRVIVDPYLDSNPASPFRVEDLDEVHAVLVTHSHFDHVGEAASVASRFGARIVAFPHLASRIAAEAGDEALALPLNFGGTVEAAGMQISMVRAHHGGEDGAAAGFVVKCGDRYVYHAGDTDLFGDMELIGGRYPVDLALLPTGGTYTMDSRDAAEAVGLLKPSIVVPIHYGTFPVLEQDAAEFAARVREAHPEVRVEILSPGDTMVL